MEVDDAIVMAEPPTALTASSAAEDDKTVLGAGSEDSGGEREQNTPNSSLIKAKRAKHKHDKEEPPGDKGIRNNEPMVTATPLKLEVSGSEDEGNIEDDDGDENGADGVARAAIRRKLLSTPLEDDGTANDGLEEYEVVALKRKRYEVRRSGSEECLLGFDELSGEAELIKAEDIQEKSEEKETSDMEKVSVVAPDLPVNTPKSIKKTPTRKNAQSPLQNSMRSTSRSPKCQKAKSPLQDSPPNKAAQKTPPTTHIVGDGEETNGTQDVDMAPAVQTPPFAGSGKKPLSPHDDFYKKPFDFGWKRELVWRANIEASKDKADVYFISPAGKKMRTRNEIIPLLEGDLTIDHFCFIREPLGAAPDFEIVRSAKPSSRSSVATATLAAAPSPPIVGKRVSKPKGPKGASPPPQGWTPSKALKVNNAALLSGSGVVGGGAGGGRLSLSSQLHQQQQQQQHHHHTTTPSSRRQENTSAPIGHTTKSNKSKKSSSSSSSTSSHAKAESHSNYEVRRAAAKESCNIGCARAAGQLPQLQCTKCFCLYHHECVDVDKHTSDYRTTSSTHGREYICEACSPKPLQKASNNTTPPAPLLSAPAGRIVQGASGSPVLPKPMKVPTTKKGRQENKHPQTIAVVKGKKYVMVAKPLTLPNEPANDIENDLKQINESIRKNRKQSNNSLEAGSHHTSNTHNSQVATAEQSNKMFATNFFANVSYAYDSLLCIMKYLKIHERPRAAAVCKLWHLAAKDTSLWKTVRMKNSKVCSWSGFAAALRRGETKHLDLRKMLQNSGRSEDLWNDFCDNIGTVCSLESLYLCRCSARVVESLFQSNRSLRVINALAINDDTINLENVALLTSLEELRLRTCESGVLAGDLTPLASLGKLIHLSLTSIKGLGDKCVEVLGELTTLRSLELGECGDFDSTFAEAVLPKLINLQRLRLENGQVTNVCTLEILDAVARLVQLHQLELVNFDIKPGFDEKLCLCTNITKMLIIPTYISQSATTNQIVLSAVQQVSESLKVFTWCVTVELLRVTALYVDQCEESTKKEKHHFDECIPVLKPVPGAPPADDDDEETEIKSHNADTSGGEDGNGDVPQIEILPLDKVETILAENLPHTKFTIVKVPYHLTSKQQLVD
uniref:MBD domain-containing protein n=1 Tax=Stomoxys calcitrans TaxID=35570 RepID=A0A1I8PHW1_STOCA